MYQVHRVSHIGMTHGLLAVSGTGLDVLGMGCVEGAKTPEAEPT